MEQQLGRTRSEQIMMDLDLMQFNDTRHHLADWSRPHIRRLLGILLFLIIGMTYAFPRTPPSDADNKAARELLTKATEYFQGSKYHEAVLCFKKLQKRYTLTPRYLAYLGFSYYKEGDYEEAVKILLPLVSDTTRTATLMALSPKEQSVYLYACGESLFHSGDYARSLAMHRRVLPLVSGLDKADVLFHIGMAYYLQADNAAAIEPLEEALALYRHHTTPADNLHTARLSQVEKMLPGLRFKGSHP
jgi:tetratricopeptide (TPR) repeat protein